MTPDGLPVAPAAPISAVRSEPSERLQGLIAGRVSRPVDFDDAATTGGAAQTYQLYNRAADKLEAAVRVGTNLDLRG